MFESQKVAAVASFFLKGMFFKLAMIFFNQKSLQIAQIIKCPNSGLDYLYFVLFKQKFTERTVYFQ